jgi:hypothetical protein
MIEWPKIGLAISAECVETPTVIKAPKCRPNGCPGAFRYMYKCELVPIVNYHGYAV